MITKILCFITASIMCLLFSESNVHASFLDYLMGYHPEINQDYTYNATNSGQPQYPGAVQYQPPAYTAVPSTPHQAVVGPQPVPARAAYQQPPTQNRSTPPGRPTVKAASTKKAVQSAAARRSLPSAGTQMSNQPKPGPAPRSYQQNFPAQPRPMVQQAPAASYYGNPYQPRYSSAPNYYQGSSYNGWGSSGQACPPGRA